MINSLLSFGAKSVNPLLLEETLTTRKIVVDEIEHKCVAKILKHTTYQSLVIAPRGSGKTHMTKVLHHRLINNEVIRDKCVIAYMSEDEVGIDSLTDLIVSMFRAFIRYGEDGSDILNGKIEEAADISNINERIAFIKTTLNEFANDRIIILLIENFDQIMEALKKNGQEELRDFIHEYNNLSIIATSQNLIQGLQKSDYPFYNFFNIFNLKRLTYDESVAFFKKIASAENHTDLIKEMDTPTFKGKLKAIYELTEGNHRLLVTFYSFLKAEYKSEFSNVFVKVMNDLKPYYEQFIAALSTQQQKIVKFLSQHRRAISGKEIARACFIEPNTLSKQTSLLYEMRMIDKTKSGKDVFYELCEPLMRISFEIGDNPNGIASLFVDFLSSFYATEEISLKYLEYKYGAKFQVEELRPKYLSEANMYYLALPDPLRTAIETTEGHLKSIGNLEELNEKIKDIIPQIHLKSQTTLDVTEIRNKILGLQGIDIGIDISLIELADTLTNNIALSLEQMNNAVFLIEHKSGNTKVLPDLIKTLRVSIESASFTLGTDLYSELLHEVHQGVENVLGNIKSLKKILNKPAFQNSFILHSALGRAFRDNYDLEMAIQHYLKCYEQAPRNIEILTAIIEIYSELGDYTKSLHYIKTALDYNPENATFLGYLELNLVQLEMLEELKPIIQRNISSMKPHEIQDYLGSLIFIIFFTEKSTPFLTTVSSYLYEVLNNKSETQKLWHAITIFIFTYLTNSQSLTLENGEAIRTRMMNSLSNYKEATIPLKMLSVGIAYLKRGEKNALFELSKEERKVFQENVLDKIEKKNK